MTWGEIKYGKIWWRVMKSMKWKVVKSDDISDEVRYGRNDMASDKMWQYPKSRIADDRNDEVRKCMNEMDRWQGEM